MTKRAIGLILLAVQKKLQKLVSQHTEEMLSPEEFHRAMTHPEVQEVMQKHILSEDIQMVEPETNKPIYRKQMSIIGEKGNRAAMESPVRGSSPDASALCDVEPEDAELVAAEGAVKEVANAVDRLKRTNSLN